MSSSSCMDMSDCIMDLDFVQITVSRQQSGAYVIGRYVEPPPEQFFPQASVQPVSGKEQLLLPEGVRTRQKITIYTTFRLMTSSQSTSQRADVVTYKNQEFEVFSVEDWSSIANYYKAICVLRGQG